MFRYYSRESDTAMPGGLCTKLCHAFLVHLTVFFTTREFDEVKISLI